MSKKRPINIEEIKKIISRSGYLVEQRVLGEFEKHGFFVGANYAFKDQDEHKSREVDAIVTKYTDFEFGKTGFCFFAYVEVKKRTNPLVFFERKPVKRETLEVFIPAIATQEFFFHIDPLLYVKKVLRFVDIHHQAKHDLLSTQFCEIYKNKALHKNLYEGLLVPLLKCVDSEIADMRKGIGAFDPTDPKFFLFLFQPIIVIRGPLYAYAIESDTLAKKDYILYRRHYASKTVRRTLLFDIVAEDYLPIYVSEKLSKTYHAVESELKKKIPEILEYCHKDRVIRGKQVQEMLKKWGIK